jgi:hypothetical protein
MYITKQFTPQEMFRMVWDTPVLILARQIGVSDVGLAKACRRAGITLPTRGHWAKPESKRPNKPKPPVSTDVIEFRVLDPETLSKLPAKMTPIASRQIAMPSSLVDPHPLVKRWIYAARKAKVVNGYSSLKSGDFLDGKVSKTEIDRCALLYDTLIKESKQLGYEWSVHSGGTRIVVDGEKLLVAIQERITRTEIPRPPPRVLKPGQPWEPDFSNLEPRYSWHPTGELSLHLIASTELRERKNWSDTKTRRLEEKLGQIIDTLPKIAASGKAYREKWEAQERKWAEQARESEEREELARRAKRLRLNLVANALDWERAERLRTFISAVVETAPKDEQSQQALGLWVTWAQHQVGMLNPLSREGQPVFTMTVASDLNSYSKTLTGVSDDSNNWFEDA